MRCVFILTGIIFLLAWMVFQFLYQRLACDTVFASSQLDPMVARSGDGGSLRWLKRHIVGESRVTKKNIAHFISVLSKGTEQPRVLIIGSGEIGSGTAGLYSSDIQLVGTDIYLSPYVDFVADAHYLPFKNKCFRWGCYSGSS